MDLTWLGENSLQGFCKIQTWEMPRAHQTVASETRGYMDGVCMHAARKQDTENVSRMKTLLLIKSISLPHYFQHITLNISLITSSIILKMCKNHVQSPQRFELWQKQWLFFPFFKIIFSLLLQITMFCCLITLWKLFTIDESWFWKHLYEQKPLVLKVPITYYNIPQF